MGGAPFAHWLTSMKFEKPARILFFVALLFTLFMALNPHPPQLMIDRFGDKFEHMLAFATLTLLARAGFRSMPGWLVVERMSFLGAMIEVFQAIPSLHRDCDWHDWLADTIAAVAAKLIADLVLPRLDAAAAPRRAEEE